MKKLSETILEPLQCIGYNPCMEWEIEGTDEFAEWYGALDNASKKAVESAIIVLSVEGPALDAHSLTP